MQKLPQLIDHLEDHITKSDVVNSTVSQSSVGWHIEHSLLVFNQIVAAIRNSDPGKYKWKFNFLRTLIYSINKIPRGKVKAPQSVLPKSPTDADQIRNELNQARLNLADLALLHPDKYFRHPVFGDLNLKPSIKFLQMHTTHHIKIIDEILK